jgi:hypothetical protein
MKTKSMFVVAAIAVLTLSHSQPANAQSWVIGGNTVTKDTTLGTKNSFALKFITNNSERVRITSSGNVGIGTKNPSAKLDIVGINNWDVGNTEGDFRLGNSTYRLKMGVAIGGIGAGDIRIRAVGGTNRLMLGGGALDVLTINGSGKVGIGTIAPGYMLDVAGPINLSSLYLKGILTMHAPGTNNFFAGPNAGNTTVASSYNTATGANALHSLTSGGYNTANGVNALSSNTTGNWNTANGYHALWSNTTGGANTANGYDVLYYNTTGANNTGNGDNALYSNTSGTWNVANGVDALYSNTTGYLNTANGGYALYSNTTGVANTANGLNALDANTTGSFNTALGLYAGHNVTTGNNNTFIGYSADTGPGDIYNAIAIGREAFVSSDNTVRIGFSAIYSIGGYVDWTNVSDGRIKKNIKNNVPGLAFINKLNPITYNLDLEAADRIIQRPAPKDGKTIAPAQEEIAARKAKEQIAYTGFVAQEVEKAAKELNYDFSGVDAAKNDKDLYGLRYAEFVVPLVKAMQELSKKNNEKDAKITDMNGKISDMNGKISDLQKQIDELKGVKTASTQTTDAAQSATTKLMPSSASLDQNNPNPFTSATTIRYSLPAGFSAAHIVIRDNSGKTIKQVQLNTAGNGTVNIDASKLTSGTYNYSLVVDGKVIENKKMIVAH